MSPTVPKREVIIGFKVGRQQRDHFAKLLRSREMTRSRFLHACMLSFIRITRRGEEVALPIELITVAQRRVLEEHGRN